MSAIRLGALVLAAGKGTRMYSPQPKVLMRLLGRPMLGYVLDALKPVFKDKVFTVIGHMAEDVEAAFPEEKERFIRQTEQLGTGHALQESMQTLEQAGVSHVVVVNGDTPLVSSKILDSFVSRSLDQKADLAFISLKLDDPGSFGRVVREDGRLSAIIEAKDYDDKVFGPASGEINAGIYFIGLDKIGPLLSKLGNNNKSKEYYITDLVGLALEHGLKAEGVCSGDDQRLLGINTPAELVQAEEYLRKGIVDDLLSSGVMAHAPESVRIGPFVRIEPGVEITGPCEILGRSSAAAGARIESNTVIKDSRLEAGCVIHSFSHLEGAVVGEKCQVGPFARLRPGARLETGAKVGNFVEMKKAVLGPGAKASHLTYLGDASVGAEANIGAGTITCNYDGKNKHQTTIGKQAFIGSNSALVAPVTIGDQALVGAGSVITKDVPDGALGVARGKQKNIPLKSKS